MIKATTVRVILTIAVSKTWLVRQIDINNAFLNGNLQEAVYMYQPKRFEDLEKPDYVCKLQKALYGLKQAPRAWNEKLRTTLIQWGFTNSKYDSSLFFVKDSGQVIFILIYVDDMIFTGNNLVSLQIFIDNMYVFALNDMGPLHLFLGIE